MLHEKMEAGLAALPLMVKASFPPALRTAMLDQAAATDHAMDRIKQLAGLMVEASDLIAIQAQEIDTLRAQLATLSK